MGSPSSLNQIITVYHLDPEAGWGLVTLVAQCREAVIWLLDPLPAPGNSHLQETFLPQPASRISPLLRDGEGSSRLLFISTSILACFFLLSSALLYCHRELQHALVEQLLVLDLGFSLTELMIVWYFLLSAFCITTTNFDFTQMNPTCH